MGGKCSISPEGNIPSSSGGESCGWRRYKDLTGVLMDPGTTRACAVHISSPVSVYELIENLSPFMFTT